MLPGATHRHRRSHPRSLQALELAESKHSEETLQHTREQQRAQQEQAMMEQEQANAQAAQIKDLGAANQSLSNAAG